MIPSSAAVGSARSAHRLPLVLVFALVLVLVTGMSPAHATKVPIPEPRWTDYNNLAEYRAQLAVRLNEVRAERDLPEIVFYDTCVQGLSQRWARGDAASGELGMPDDYKMGRKCKTPWAGGWGIAGFGLPPDDAVDHMVTRHPEEVFARGAQRLGIGMARATNGERYVFVSMTKAKKKRKRG